MGILELLGKPDIDRGVAAFRDHPHALLLDVRTPAEYRQGHIPGSRNIPLQTIDKVTQLEENKDVTLFVYCHSGARSRQAVAALRRMGYTNVQNIGGIAAYGGKVEV